MRLSHRATGPILTEINVMKLNIMVEGRVNAFDVPDEMVVGLLQRDHDEDVLTRPQRPVAERLHAGAEAVVF